MPAKSFCLVLVDVLLCCKEDLDLISVVYNVYTRHGLQMSQSSWWPKNSICMGGGLNTGFWSGFVEKWFHICLEHIYHNTAELRGGKTWKVGMVMNKKTPKFLDHSNKIVSLWFQIITQWSNYICLDLVC
ncbi:hypothetical protein SERLA73DRAFT_149135 [Serpula lacrymans var. lacrymans S7.3]|uniref:Uncharacterized protein n=1 Tax=Serpula lacrymans var. lacrymans (strain S7.3) TaxID=936435 RepID=F8PFH1_SERL3|nr:hypothetical protein SERLA73DRAFT_149135 [Serpula lacrymans var. lacrymans S7.3]